MRPSVVVAAVVAAGSWLAETSASAQHHRHGGSQTPATVAEPPQATTHATHADADHGAMTTGPLGVSRARAGSGTSWMPDETPMHALHGRAAGWDLMFHANLFAGFDSQSSDAGDDAVISTNWLMAMAHHRLGPGELGLRTMLSLEPLTVGEEGYPLLLQTGETVDGAPLVDRQHPHDLFMELAAMYTWEVTGDVGVEIYAGLAGEPALGATAFPHRLSAMSDPLAPLSHHWQDSTHISYGVLTVGVFNRWAKLEGSWFNGREPDEERYDLDLRGFDSFATRLSVNPSRSWSLQASYGFLESPEALEPDVSVHRLSASAMFTRTFGRRSWATTAIWGRNMPSHGDASDSLLVESALDLGRWGTTFGRAELVVKDGHDFGFEGDLAEEQLPVAGFVLGHLHNLPAVGSFVPGLGVRGSLNVVDEQLEARYGTRVPIGVMVFVRVLPKAADMRASHTQM